MCRPWRWFWGIVPLALIALLALYFKPAPMEADLSARTAGDLAAAGYDWAEISFDGRDLTLGGTAPSEEAQSAARSLAARTYNNLMDQAAASGFDTSRVQLTLQTGCM